MRILTVILALALPLISPATTAEIHLQRCGLQATTDREWWVWRNKDVIMFVSGLSIDADGSPRAYHPDNISGLDDLSHAGRPRHWVGLLTVNGVPVVQGRQDPAPSFFVSATALEDNAYPVTSPAHFVNAETIPYIALPRDLDGPQLGDLAYVFNRGNGRASAAIVADESPHPGEGSIALARALGIDADARQGGAADGIVSVVFLHSGRPAPLPGAEIDARGRHLREQLGVDNLLSCIVEPVRAATTRPLR